MAGVLGARLSHRAFLKWCGLAIVGAGAAGAGQLVTPPSVAFAQVIPEDLEVQGNIYASGPTGRWIGFGGTNNLMWDSSLGPFINSTASFVINLDSNNDDPDNRYFAIAKNAATFTGGTELFRVQESGKVGIGIGGPWGRFQVNNGPTSIVFSTDGTGLGNDFMQAYNQNGLLFSISSYGAGSNLIAEIGANFGVDGTNGVTRYAVLGTKKAPMLRLNAEDGSLGLYGENGTGGNYRTPALNLGAFVKGDGNVGIGTTNPNEKLDVAGHIRAYRSDGSPSIFVSDFGDHQPALIISRAGGTPGAPSDTGATGAGIDMGSFLVQGYNNGGYRSLGGMTVHSDGAFSPGNTPGRIELRTMPAFATGAVSRLMIDSQGYVSIGKVANYWEPNPEYLAIEHDSTADRVTLVGRAGGVGVAPEIRIQPGSGKHLILVLESGNVGIGRTDPAEKLHVAGNIKVDGVLDGTAKQSYYAQ
ncbi:MAG: hypothetical protein HY331_16210 [Chloroflexi bacterium]|nr:hypothetical protein [Chloroflexota bacterium]